MAKINTLRTRLRNYRDSRLQKDELEKKLKSAQPELIDAMKEAGVTNSIGIVYDPDDENKGAAYVQQNTPGEFWDEEAILDWLNRPVKGRRALRLACTTRVLSIQHFEAEVAAGNIPAKVANRLKKTADTPNPFIRFGKINDKSIT